MKLPNAQQAIVDDRKVRDYLLSPSHPIGRFKAAFLADLGFTPEHWREFQSRLQSLAVNQEAELAEETEYGQKYLICGILTGPGGASAEVVTVWILRSDDDRPRLVTVYPR